MTSLGARDSAGDHRIEPLSVPLMVDKIIIIVVILISIAIPIVIVDVRARTRWSRSHGDTASQRGGRVTRREKQRDASAARE